MLELTSVEVFVGVPLVQDAQLLKLGGPAAVVLVCVVAVLLCQEMPAHTLKNVSLLQQDVLFVVQLVLVVATLTLLILEDVHYQRNYAGLVLERMDVSVRKAAEEVAAFV